MLATSNHHRLVSDPAAEHVVPFDKLARFAGENDVFIGYSCPTKTNPRVDRCHTFVALEFIKSKFPELQVELPAL